MKNITLSCLVFFFLPAIMQAQSATQHAGELSKIMTGDDAIPAYVIERTIPGAGQLTSQQLKEVSQVSCNALDSLGSGIQWLHSYVTADKVYCVYRATDRIMLERHAAIGGFPIDAISPLSTMISPSTANIPDKQ